MNNMLSLTDESLMPYGKYKGCKMANVPAQYLLFCYENGKCSLDVSKYVQDNYDILNEEINQVEEN